MVRLTTFLFSFVFMILFSSFHPLKAQNYAETQIQQEKYDRNLRAIKTHVQDGFSYFEGFVLCNKYPEKKKLLADIEETVERVDQYAMQIDYKIHPEVAELRAKAHLLKGVAYGLLGEKKLADIALFEANEPILVDSVDVTSFKTSEIRIGERNRQLRELESEQYHLQKELAAVQVVIDPDRREELGYNLQLQQKSKSPISMPEHAPFVVAYGGDKIRQMIVKDARREIIYLPPGNYQIIKPDKDWVVTEFQIKKVTDSPSISLPPSKFPMKLVLIGAGAAALIAVGALAF